MLVLALCLVLILRSILLFEALRTHVERVCKITSIVLASARAWRFISRDRSVFMNHKHDVSIMLVDATRVESARPISAARNSPHKLSLDLSGIQT